MEKNNFKVGDNVRIRTNVTLEEIKANNFNGCQYNTMKFLLNESGAINKNFGRIFKIRKIFNECILLEDDDEVLNPVIFEKVKVKEMTMKQLNEYFNCEVKIVKEEN